MFLKRGQNIQQVSKKIYFLAYMIDLTKVKGSHQVFAEHLLIVAANAIFRNQKQSLRDIFKNVVFENYTSELPKLTNE